MVYRTRHGYENHNKQSGNTVFGSVYYWLDEEGFKDVQSKYYKNGNWDKEGVKNYLALPCFNRASSISTVEVNETTTAVQSNIVKARELIQYTDTSGYNTGMLGKIMSGGGTQITANPAVLKLIM